MAKMHANEFEIDERLVYTLLENQCPHWADLPLKAIISNATENALFRLGSEYVVRLPRTDPGESVHNECEWLPKIAPFLKVPIPVPLFKGKPDWLYPWPWTVTRWHLGYSPNFERKREHDLLAKDLAHFLNALHKIELPNGPLSRRGIPLKERDVPTRKAINELRGEIDIPSVTALWEQLSNVPSWSKDPVWVHGDFLPDNILAQCFRLSAVIDFSMMGIGDPACDLIIAWSLFNPHSRKIFKDTLENIDDDTWERGRGWALSIALIMLSYYKNKSYSLSFLAKRMITHVLDNVVEIYIPPKRKKSKLFLFFEKFFKK